MYSKPLDVKKGTAGIIIVILGFNPYQVTEWESWIVAAAYAEGGRNFFHHTACQCHIMEFSIVPFEA
jgi:hypothetical protein